MTRLAAFLPYFIAASCWGATMKPSDDQIRIISQAGTLVFSDSFKQAYRLCDKLNDTTPGTPLYHILRASILHAEMTDAEEYGKKKVFFAHIDTSVQILKDWIKKNPDDPWAYFLLGSAYGYKSVWHGQMKSWLKSLIAGLKAKGKYSRAIKLDPRLYDAYTGMGNYHYWSSAKLRKYLPFLKDNREKGLSEMRLAVDSSLISSMAAATGLAWALINEKKPSEAARIGRTLYEKTSGGRVSLWILGGAYWRMGNLQLAEKYYSELIESLERTDQENHYNLIFCRYRKGVCYYGLRNYEAALYEFETLLSYDASKRVRKEHKKTYKKAEEYLKKIKSKTTDG